MSSDDHDDPDTILADNGDPAHDPAYWRERLEDDIKTFARQMARRAGEYRRAGRHQEADLIVEAAMIEAERMRRGEEF